ncbi:RDD family protein [Planctomycetota bacterium]|nr:RDD family protein [Planctomycetota bacterium]
MQTSYRANFTDATRPIFGAARASNFMHTAPVELPENVKASFELATPISRMFAFLLDSGVQIISFIIFVAVIGIMSPAFSFSDGFGFLVAFVIVVAFAIFVGYYFFMEGLFAGRTLGKMALGLRVIREDGEEIGPARGIIRAFMRFLIIGPMPILLAFGVFNADVLAAAPFFLLGGLMFLDPQARGVPDFAAGTLVIKQSLPPYRLNRPYVPLYFELPHHYFPLNHAEMEALTPDDYVKLEQFGTRLSTIRSTARRQAAVSAAAALATRMNYGVPVDPDYAEVFLFEMHSALKQQLQQLYPDLYE